jgi:hypothetical protein
MRDSHRRRFLKQSAGVLSALAATRCAPGPAGEPTAPPLDRDRLLALGAVVLPVGALGRDGVERVVSGFAKWLDEFLPVAELDHPYGDDEILYGPADPKPRFRADLEALDLEAAKRFGRSFTEASEEERQTIVRLQVRGMTRGSLPSPGEARHVAVGLLSYFYATSEANDLCYEAAIQRWECRGLDTARDKPGPR